MNEIQLMEVENRSIYIDDLLLADEDEAIVETYIHTGRMYVILLDGKEIGVCLFTFPSEGTVEIKNFAIRKPYRGKGFGKKVISASTPLFQKLGYNEMIVGTANSSIENLAFYQKAGFRFYDIKKDYFLSYPRPFYENEIQGLDLIIFQRHLNP